MTTYALKVDGEIIPTNGVLKDVFSEAERIASEQPDAVVVVEEVEEGSKAIFWSNKPG